jgi:uncharacterized DUF497 family protein
MGMSFEFDENKSATNKIKHGIDFTEAQKLWDFQILQFKLPYEAEE